MSNYKGFTDGTKEFSSNNYVWDKEIDKIYNLLGTLDEMKKNKICLGG
jgi:hypothetical protein